MIVTRENFDEILAMLMGAEELALDTETTGLRPYHGDRVFSIIVAPSSVLAYYFNFQTYAKVGEEHVLTMTHMRRFFDLFEQEHILWFLQNAKFDMRMLAQEDLFLAGQIHCTRAIGRVEYNAHMSYSLADQLERIGLAKNAVVEAYVKEHKLWTMEEIPGKNTKNKHMHYERIPLPIIHPYGEMDGTGTFALGRHQIKAIERMTLEDDKRIDSGSRNLIRVMNNERRLTETLFRMEHTGVLIDVDFCKRAIEYETEQMHGFERAFKSATGEAYKSSGPLFQRVFADQKHRWEYTEKGNPSFESEVLKKFGTPNSQTVLAIRESKSKLDFIQGFLYHADGSNRLHPTFNPDGTAHGRLSSSEPNFQNLTDEDDTDIEFKVRRAIIPAPGFKLLSIDYQAMEYRFMLEMACRLIGKETELVTLIKGGLDVHEATALLASKSGVQISRKEAKTSNFLTLYGGGNQKLADGLGCSLDQAKAIRGAIFDGAPEMRRYIQWVMAKAESVGYITNWLGRRSYFPNRSFAYKAPNYHCSGGCADIVKIAMNQIDQYLQERGAKSRMIMTVHDELVFEVARDEDDIAFPLQRIMENVFVSKYLPLVTEASWSEKSLGDLK